MNKTRDPLLLKVGELLRSARQKKGWSQEKVAFQSEISSDYYGRVERGNVNPSLTTLYKVATALDTTVSNLLKDLK